MNITEKHRLNRITIKFFTKQTTNKLQVHIYPYFMSIYPKLVLYSGWSRTNFVTHHEGVLH